MTQSITGTEKAADQALHQEFGVRFHQVNAVGASALRDDLIALAHDEDLTLEHAARVLNRRIGGKENLLSYAGSLLASINRRQAQQLAAGTIDVLRCDCGASDPTWHGGVGLRVFCCDSCWAKRRCGHCGSLKPVGQSCACFDNGCQ